MATGVQVVFDCADPAAMARFWAPALHYIEQPPPSGFASWPDWLRDQGIPKEDWNKASAVVDPDGKGPRIYFQRVPEGKVAKNRVHLDLNVGRDAIPPQTHQERVDAEVDRLVGLGASRVRHVEQHGEYWVTMLDPEGNEFCVQ
jgi:Glyoxalase-like domain